MPFIQFNVYYTLSSNTNKNRPSNNWLVIHFMLLIQFMPLIQFNVCYTLHSNTNNNRPSNNLLVIDFMLLIQFMLLIICGFCDRDLRRQDAATAKRLWTETRRAEQQGPQRPGWRPEGPTISGGLVALQLSSWYGKTSYRGAIGTVPSEASTRMASMGCSLAYDRVI